ncbi:MAG: SRPBCC domain-containing protein [Actinomycetes bacterium]
MSTQTTMPPVRRTVTVKQPLDKAFALFTTRIDQWWPQGRALATGVGAAAGGTVVLEPRQHGQVYRRAVDGSIEYWGEVLVWEPPTRLVLAWRPAPDSPAATEVEVRFTPEGDGTKVELEHRGWEQLGQRAAAARAEYETAWGDVLTQYAGASRDNGPAIASLILGISSIVVPLLGIVAAPFAIAFGIAGRRRARSGAGHGGVAAAGLTLGAIGLVLWGLLALGLALVVYESGGGSEERHPVPVESVQPRD